MIKLHWALAASALALCAPALAQSLTAAEQAKVDTLVTSTLAETGTPSASIALVRGGRIVMTKAYGKASDALGAATPTMPYQIASNSKQFTAMALLLLADEHKLSLDDRVAKWLPGISGGGSIRLRQLLSHTSGLQDFWPQDYLFDEMKQPTAPQGIVDRWAKKPLDYAPGSALAIFEHRLCGGRADRGKGGGPAVDDLPHPAHLPPAGDAAARSRRHEQ